MNQRTIMTHSPHSRQTSFFRHFWNETRKKGRSWRQLLPVLGMFILCAGPSTAGAAPVANNQSVNVPIQSQNYYIGLSYTDTGTTPMFTLLSVPSKGFLTYWGGALGYLPLTINSPISAATFNYTSTGTVAGTDSFTWQVSDGAATSTPATASITLTANSTPIANTASV